MGENGATKEEERKERREGERYACIMEGGECKEEQKKVDEGSKVN
jgi:hypothetical protein